MINIQRSEANLDQENMSELFNKFGKMMENGEIPDNIKNLLNNSGNFNSDSQNSSTHNDANVASDSQNSSNSNDSFNLDFETILKLQKIMSSMKNQKNDPRTNLLLSLKPYLKESRQQKVEQYINIFKMTKVLDLLNNSGGENKK